MTCKEASSLVTPFITHQLDDDKMADFLDHIDSCAECRDELETYFMVVAGIRQLDNDSDDYNIKGYMEDEIRSSKDRLFITRVMDTVRYAADTLIWLCLTVMFVLLIRLMWQQGLFI